MKNQFKDLDQRRWVHREKISSILVRYHLEIDWVSLF